jgi:1-acyl-sn-glycerol-3-phosphate acyltransferase
MPKRNVPWYRFVRGLVRVTFFNLTGGLRSVDEHNVPRSGATIIAPIHISHLDPPAVACGTKRRLNFMAKEELFRGLFGMIIASVGAFPVRRGTNDTEAIRRTLALLEEGEAVLIFPEGTRGDGERMLPINRGVAMMAKRTDAQVVPVGIVGTHIVWPRGQKKLRRHRITLAFGQPFRYSEIATAPSEKENREAFASILEDRIRELCGRHGWAVKSAETDSGSPGSSSPEPETGGQPPGPASTPGPT